MHMSNGKSMSVSASTCTTCTSCKNSTTVQHIVCHAKEHKRGDNVAVHNLRWPRPPATTAFDRNRCFRVLNPLQLHNKLSLRVIGTAHRVVGTGTPNLRSRAGSGGFRAGSSRARARRLPSGERRGDPLSHRAPRSGSIRNRSGTSQALLGSSVPVPISRPTQHVKQISRASIVKSPLGGIDNNARTQ